MLFIERITITIVYLFSIFLLYILLTSSAPLEVNVGEVDKVIKMTMFFMVVIVPVLLSLLTYYVKQNTKAERETTATYLKIIANQEARGDKEVQTLSAIAEALKIIEQNQVAQRDDLKEVKSMLIKDRLAQA